MAIASSQGGAYRVSVEADYNFAADQSRLFIWKKDGERYRPIVLELKEFEPIIPNSTRGDLPERATGTLVPNELAHALMALWANYFLSPETDLVTTLKRTERERDYFKKQLSDLIAGIGRLGGSQ